MTTPAINDDVVGAFKALFSGYTGAHGTFEIKSTDPQTEKKSGIARTILNALTTCSWREHLAGALRGLGVIPLLGDGESVKWAAIDIDVNDIDHACLEAKAVELGLPLVVCRSKSGGAHCYLFLEQPCPAKDVVDALTNWSAALGYPGVEIFPKQTRRALDPKTGNPLGSIFHTSQPITPNGIVSLAGDASPYQSSFTWPRAVVPIKAR